MYKFQYKKIVCDKKVCRALVFYNGKYDYLKMDDVDAIIGEIERAKKALQLVEMAGSDIN